MEKTLTQIGQALRCRSNLFVAAEERNGGCALGEFEETSRNAEEEKVSDDACKTSGSSPQLAESGGRILTGRGLQQVRERIKAAFTEIHLGQPAPVKEVQEVKEERQPQIYTETQADKFHQRAKKLALASLENSFIARAPRNNVWIIETTSQTPEELYKAALGDE
jgi:hypothetical protein